MLKNNYRKIGKKNDNNVDTNMAQRKHSNIKRYASAFSKYIYIYIYNNKHQIAQIMFCNGIIYIIFLYIIFLNFFYNTIV